MKDLNKKKVALIHPGERGMLHDAGDRPPLGLMYLSAALEKKGIESKIYDLNHYDESTLIRDIVIDEPTHIGISVFTTPVLEKSKELFEKLHTNYPKKGVKYIAGGYHVSAMRTYDDFHQLPAFVDRIKGYGERELVNLFTDEVKEFDINEFPIPNRRALNPHNYKMKVEGLDATLMTTARGCPFSCVFCGNFDKKVKYRDIDNIDEEMNLIKRMGNKAVYFTDDSFTLNHRHFAQVAQSAKDHGLKYRIATRASLIDNHVADILADTGCSLVGLGIESGNDDVLKASSKQMDKSTNEKAVEILTKHKINTKGFFILGLPKETEESARQTIDFSLRLRDKGLTYADFYPLVPFPGSAVYSHPGMFGIKIRHHNFSKYLQAGEETPEPIAENINLHHDKIKVLLEEAKSRWKN